MLPFFLALLSLVASDALEKSSLSSWTKATKGLWGGGSKETGPRRASFWPQKVLFTRVFPALMRLGSKGLNF